MNHLRWNLLSRFAGDKNNASPIFAQHTRQILPAKTDATHHVRLEKSKPIRVHNFRERLWLKNSEVVNKNIRLGHLFRESLDPVSRRQVTGNPPNISLRSLFANFLHRCIHARLRPPVDNDLDAFSSQSIRNGKTDACGRTAYNSNLPLKA